MSSDDSFSFGRVNPDAFRPTPAYGGFAAIAAAASTAHSSGVSSGIAAYAFDFSNLIPTEAMAEQTAAHKTPVAGYPPIEQVTRDFGAPATVNEKTASHKTGTDQTVAFDFFNWNPLPQPQPSDVYFSGFVEVDAKAIQAARPVDLGLGPVDTGAFSNTSPKSTEWAGFGGGIVFDTPEPQPQPQPHAAGTFDFVKVDMKAMRAASLKEAVELVRSYQSTFRLEANEYLRAFDLIVRHTNALQLVNASVSCSESRSDEWIADMHGR